MNQVELYQALFLPHLVKSTNKGKELGLLV